MAGPGFMGLGASPYGGMSPMTQALMGFGTGLLSGNPRTQGLARGFQAVGQAYSPEAAMQRQIMQQQMAELQRRQAQEKAYENLILGLPTGGAAAQAKAPSMMEPALGGSLVDMPGGGVEPGQVQTAMKAPAAAGPSMIGNVQLPPGVTSEQFLRALGPQRGMQFLAQAYQPQAGAKRDRVQDAAGFWRFVDTGERVFPDVSKPAEQPDPSEVGGMRKEFSGQSKDYRLVRDAFRKIQNAATGEPSAGGDMSLIFSYMKMLDPGSTVREGEFATAQNTAGVPTQVRNMYNRAKTGQMLAPEQRSDFLNQAQRIYGAQAESQSLLEEQYRGLADRAGYNPENVVLDYQGDLRGQSLAAEAPESAPTATNPETGERLILRDGKWEPM